MRPYNFIRLTEMPDIAEIHCEGRNTSAGGKDYFRNKQKKAAIRRTQKHRDKMKYVCDSQQKFLYTY